MTAPSKIIFFSLVASIVYLNFLEASSHKFESFKIVFAIIISDFNYSFSAEIFYYITSLVYISVSNYLFCSYIYFFN